MTPKISVCCAHLSDFMAVRKIPLKQRPYLTDSATESNSAEVRQASSEEGINESRRPSDPAVQKILALIRKRVLSDRALHDQVGIAAHVATQNFQCGLGLEVTHIFCPFLPFSGRRGICIVYQSIF